MKRCCGLTVLCFLLCVPPPARAGLPQAHPYQVTLRSYMATLTEADFALTLSPCTYDASYLTTIDDVYRMWLGVQGGYRPGTGGISLPPSRFLLSNIESGGAVNMSEAYVDGAQTAWWAQWNYAGNPYRPGTANSTALKKRAFVAAACDLMMVDANHEATSTSVRSDCMGGSLIWQAYAYYVAKDILPANVCAAYEEGLTKIIERIESVYPYGSGGSDMETFQLVGLWYAAQAIGTDDMKARALARSRYVLAQRILPPGYESHGGACDSSYLGIALRFATWGAMLYNDPEITAALGRMLKLKAHLSLPEPDNASLNSQSYAGPCHFNTGTGMGAPNDQWPAYFRDLADAVLSDDWGLYLAFHQRYGTETGVKNEATMRSEISTSVAGWLPTAQADRTPIPWALDGGGFTPHWANGLNYAQMYCPNGFYAKLCNLVSQNSPLMACPFARTNFVQAITNAYLAVKMGGYGAVIHSDVVCGFWAANTPGSTNETRLAGLSGGGLSAFWTPGAGTVILGLNGGSQNPDNYERWSQWDIWACHAISGLGNAGKPFSSARNLNPAGTYTVCGTTSATASITGHIGGDISAPNGAITGQVNYARTFTMTPRDGLRVHSELTSDRSDSATELWEIIPLHLRLRAQTVDATLAIEANGNWITPTTTLQSGVTRVRTTRFGQSVDIVFDQPRAVKLSSAVNDRSQSFSRVRNLMVDLLGSGGAAVPMPASTSVDYIIRPTIQALPALTVVSPLGTAVPAVGTNFIPYGTTQTCAIIDSPLRNGTTQTVCTGWTFSGDSIQSGAGTNMTLSLTNDSTLRWNWATQYLLSVSAGSGGTVDPGGWYTAGSAVTVRATRSVGYAFSAWTGEIPPALTNNNPLQLTMDRPRSVTAHFIVRTGGETHYADAQSTNAFWPYLTWDTAATSIMDAVGASVASDVVVVTSGTYSVTAQIAITNAMTVRSVDGPARTTVNGNGLDRCFYLCDSNALLDGFTITGGNTNSSGGGVYCPTGTVQNCVITGNRAAASGGGLWLRSGGLARNCIIRDNSAGNRGGGVYMISGTLQNCTLVGNAATNSGGGVYFSSGGTLKNTIVYFNTAPAAATYTNQGTGFSFESCCAPTPLTGSHNTTGSPAFLNYGMGDLHLASTSSCLNAGDNGFVTLPTDLDGRPRIQGPAVDIGAYEYPYAVIHALAGPYGSISPSGAVSVMVSSNQAFTITPAPVHAAIQDVRIDENGIGPTNRYTFVNVTNNHTIEAFFSLIYPDTNGYAIHEVSRHAGNTLLLSWPSTNGWQYMLQKTPTLAPAAWSNVSCYTGAAGSCEVVITNDAEAASNMYYRLQSVPVD